MTEVLEINMNVREVQCSVCEEWTEHRWGIPTFNGDVVSNDFPDWLWSLHGGGQPVCRQCFDLHAAGQISVADLWYIWIDGRFVGGDGI